jgi:uncharacterized protein YqeY
MALQDKLTEDMKVAMKARDADRLSVIRMLLSDVKTDRINLMRDLTDDEEIGFLSRQAKRRRESIDAYTAANREDLAAIERRELAVIETYLPQQLTVDEVKAVIATAIAEIGATSPKDMGKLMGVLMPRLKGRFPGKDVKPLAEAMLAG